MSGTEIPLALRPENQVRLIVDGVEFGGWKSVRIAAGIERQARDYDLEVTDVWPGREDIPRRLRAGDACQVLIGDDLVMTGHIDATPIRYDGRSVSVAVRGRSKTADLVDCCPPDAGEAMPASEKSWNDVIGPDGKTANIVTPGQKTAQQWRNMKMEEIAADLAAPYGIRVIAEVDTGDKIKEHQVQIGETVFESIDRMMRLRHVLSTDNEYGDLVFINVGSAGDAVTALVAGDNILAGDAALDYKGVFSEYIVKGQRAGDDQDFGIATNEDEGIAETTASGETGVSVDGRAPRRRVLVIKQSGQADEGTCQDRANYEKAHRAAKALQTTYKVVGWRQSDGSLWEPNMMVMVRDRIIGFDTEMVIAEVAWVLSREGLVTEIKVGPPDGYVTKAGRLRNSKRLKGGGSEWTDVKPS